MKNKHCPRTRKKKNARSHSQLGISFFPPVALFFFSAPCYCRSHETSNNNSASERNFSFQLLKKAKAKQLSQRMEVVADMPVEPSGASEGNSGEGSLRGALLEGNYAEMIEILKRGSDPNAKISKAQCTPLHLAASRGHERAIEILLEYGACVDTPDKDLVTPLYVSYWSFFFLMFNSCTF